MWNSTSASSSRPRDSRRRSRAPRLMNQRRRFPGVSACVHLGLTLLAACSTGKEGGDAGAPAGDGPDRAETAPAEVAVFGDIGGLTGLPDSPRRTASPAFWDHWGDGRAELSGYHVTLDRYGEARNAELSLIYVTEPHDRRTWVKDDGAEAPDRVEVLKLIRSMHFFTGIYPYNVMASTFSPVDEWTDERFRPVRLNLDVQEWCGSVTHRVLPGAGRLRSIRLSYFADEGETRREIGVPEGTLYEDGLLIQLRELDGPFYDGGAWEGFLVRELWSLRTGHRSIEPVPARIDRTDATRDGEPVTRFRLETRGYWRTYDVETAPPRRVLAWETSTGERAEILGTERLAYWTLNARGDEQHRGALGLETR